jgi:hypothetical protein
MVHCTISIETNKLVTTVSMIVSGSNSFSPPLFEADIKFLTRRIRRHDTQHNDIQHNDTQHSNSKNMTTLRIKCHFAKCGLCSVSVFIFMLSVVILNVGMLSVIAPKTIPQSISNISRLNLLCACKLDRF